MKGLAYATLTTHNGVSEYNCSMRATAVYNYSDYTSTEAYHDDFIWLNGTTAEWVVTDVGCTVNSDYAQCTQVPLEDQVVSFATEPAFDTCPVNTVGENQINNADTATTMTNYGGWVDRATDGLVCPCTSQSQRCFFFTHQTQLALRMRSNWFRIDFGSTRLVQTVLMYVGFLANYAYEWNGIYQFIRVGDDATHWSSPLNHDCGIPISHKDMAWNEKVIDHCHVYGRYLWVVMDSYVPYKPQMISIGEIFVGGGCPCTSTSYETPYDHCQPCPMGHVCNGSSIIVPSGNLTIPIDVSTHCKYLMYWSVAFASCMTCNGETNSPRCPVSMSTVIADNPPHARYHADNWDSNTNTWMDSSGNGRHTVFATGVTRINVTGNATEGMATPLYWHDQPPATAVRSALSGHTDSSIIWPEDSLQPEFTMCALMRKTNDVGGSILRQG
jgi:hypothetical protein